MISLSRLVKGARVNLASCEFIYCAPSPASPRRHRRTPGRARPRPRRTTGAAPRSECAKSSAGASSFAPRRSGRPTTYARRPGTRASAQATARERPAPRRSLPAPATRSRNCSSARSESGRAFRAERAGDDRPGRRHRAQGVDERLKRDDEAFLRIFRGAVKGVRGQKLVRLRVSGHDLDSPPPTRTICVLWYRRRRSSRFSRWTARRAAR